jgi:polysaccharide biosynthesis/export protein
MRPIGRRIAVFLGTIAAAFLLSLLPPSALAQKVETPQQANDRLRALAASARPLPPSDYVIGAGDLIAIQVFDVPEISRELRVGQTGTIGLPLVPVRLHVSGLTEMQAEQKISEVLEVNGLVSHPEVTVTVKEKKSRPITIVGAVGHPMVYEADRQVTLIDVLAAAGGITGDAGERVIITRPEKDQSDPTQAPEISSDDAAPIVPKDKDSASSPSSATVPDPPSDIPPPLPSAPANTITVNLNQILETGDMSNNIVIQPGDVVTVPHAGIVYVLGAVTRPGGYTVANDRSQLTTLKVLSLAGGLNRTAKSDRAVIVRKDSNGQQREVEVDLKKVMKFESEDVQLRPSDILYVPTSSGKQAAFRIAELSLAIGTGVLIYRLVP